MRSQLLFPLSLSLMLCACGGEKQAEAPPTYYDANVEEGVDVSAARQEDGGQGEEDAAPRGLAFRAITLGPEEPTVEDVLVAEALLVEGSSAFADVEYTWWVGDRKVSGVRKGELQSSKGRFRRGDSVRVVASAIDERGNQAEIAAEAVEILNATPQIETDARARRGIDRLVMKASDPDGDRIRWSIEQGPPGISIDSSGRIRVRAVDVAEAFDGEVLVVASDPEGARAELHIPVSVNAAREEVLGTRTTTTVRRRRDMTDEEYEKLNIDALDRVMDMSEEEFERHTREQEERDQKD